MSSYHYGPTGDRIEDDEQPSTLSGTGASKWLPEPDCTDAWNDQNSGEECPHGVIGGLDISRLGHTRCIDCGGRRRRIKRRLTGRHLLNLDKIKSAWTRDAA
jgi:hypothetical protein